MTNIVITEAELEEYRHPPCHMKKNRLIRCKTTEEHPAEWRAYLSCGCVAAYCGRGLGRLEAVAERVGIRCHSTDDNPHPTRENVRVTWAERIN